MSTLLLKLSAPLQSWGADSHFQRRTTRHEPTKSAVLGLIAAAQGRRRTDCIEDLLDIRFGVRIDQPGVVLRDLHSAHNASGASMPFPSHRYYLSDAVFVVGLEANRILLEGIEDSLLHPLFPLFLGRRSCVPSGKLVLGVFDNDLICTLRSHQWEAARWYRRSAPNEQRLELIRDLLPGETGVMRRETVRDLPRSFSQERREYGWRNVVHDDPVIISNPDGRTEVSPSHDPMSVL